MDNQFTPIPDGYEIMTCAGCGSDVEVPPDFEGQVYRTSGPRIKINEVCPNCGAEPGPYDLGDIRVPVKDGH